MISIFACLLALTACSSGSDEKAASEKPSGVASSAPTDVIASESATEKPYALEVGKALAVEGPNGESAGITLLAEPTFTEQSGLNEDVSAIARTVIFRVKIQSDGDSTFSPFLTGHFVGDDGQMLDRTDFQCVTDPIPTGDLLPGKFVQGNMCYDVPDGPGYLGFDDPDQVMTPFILMLK